MNKNILDEVFRNINKLSLIRNNINDNYERREVFYHDVRIIDISVEIVNFFIARSEGENIDYLDENLSLFE